MLTYAIDEAYLMSMEADLHECDVRIRELKDRVERMLANAEVEHYRKIEALRGRERAIRDKLEGLTRLSNPPIQPQQTQTEIQNELDVLKRSIEMALKEYR
jgi:hypothetical protein